MEIKVKRFDNDLPLPEYEEAGAAAVDLSCGEDADIPPHQIKLIKMNIAVAIPRGYFLLVAVRSSTPLKKGLMLANSIGIVDSFFCGDRDEVVVELYNFTDQLVEVKRGEQLTQAILVKSENIDWKEVRSLGAEGRGGYVL